MDGPERVIRVEKTHPGWRQIPESGDGHRPARRGRAGGMRAGAVGGMARGVEGNRVIALYWTG